MALTPKQEKFCQEYVMYGNKSRAYRVAYNAENMSSEAIGVEAVNLCKNPKVALRIEEIQKDLTERFKTDLDETVRGVFNIANFDIAELYDEDGSFKSIHDIPKHVRTAIAGVKTYEEKVDGSTVGVNKDVRIINKLDALEKLIKYFGGYEKDNAQKIEKPKDYSKLTDDEIVALSKLEQKASQ